MLQKLKRHQKKIETEIRFNPNPKRGSRARAVVPKDARLSRNMRKFLQRIKNGERKRQGERNYLRNMRARNDAYLQRSRRRAYRRLQRELGAYSEEGYLYSIGIHDVTSCRREWGKKENPKSRSGSKRVKSKRPQKFKAKGGRRRNLDIDLNF